jgi:hypothetical protein
LSFGSVHLRLDMTVQLLTKVQSFAAICHHRQFLFLRHLS